MKLSERVHLVGSGSNGFDLTDAYDCHVYLINGGDELALIDVGAGMGAEAILANVRKDGLDPKRIKHVVLTHGHGDHAGGTARVRRLLGETTVYASGVTQRRSLQTNLLWTLSNFAQSVSSAHGRVQSLSPCSWSGELSLWHLPTRQRSSWRIVRYVMPKCTGTKRMALALKSSRSSAFWKSNESN